MTDQDIITIGRQAFRLADQSDGQLEPEKIAPLIRDYGVELVAMAMVPALMKGQDLGEFLAELCARTV